ncbi:ABC transporter permease [Alkalihalobacillus trypoxylicola]|uniref:Iron ABC transporter permease n=1 Tax=Alkalihalobacillus trypoxylicola TaxID=519424 RepID=A0A162E9J2_9BACI|nr:ABC transporter permease [Alkalihalobacillus trypoxylicola]KYG32103.1 iron ABC transporter permease [Alkalihalobacillus trypoxylicola]
MKNLILLIACLLLSIASIFIGVNNLNLAGIIQLDENQLHTLLHSRLPRLISIIIAGSSMAICGLIMQQLTRNKFVSPTTAGTMDSASLGIMVSMLMFASATMMQKMIVSFLFALVGTFIFMKILDRIKFKNIIFVPLVGLMFGNIVGSITTFFAYSNDLIQNISSWLQGSFSLIITGRYEMLYISIPLLIMAYFFANRFTIAGMGEEFSVNLGLNYKQVVNVGLIIVAAITSVVVLTVGMIPFLGLIIPNIVAIFQGDNLRKNLPTTALLGVAFVLACDIIGRVIIYPYQIPIGLTVGVIGSAIFLYLLIRGRRHGY